MIIKFHNIKKIEQADILNSRDWITLGKPYLCDASMCIPFTTQGSTATVVLVIINTINPNLKTVNVIASIHIVYNYNYICILY